MQERNDIKVETLVRSRPQSEGVVIWLIPVALPSSTALSTNLIRCSALCLCRSGRQPHTTLYTHINWFWFYSLNHDKFWIYRDGNVIPIYCRCTLGYCFNVWEKQQKAREKNREKHRRETSAEQKKHLIQRALWPFRALVTVNCRQLHRTSNAFATSDETADRSAPTDRTKNHKKRECKKKKW